ncbi:hypothetical protein MAPG_05904 [Magnaporthiopsis poae ATCC 64411]|uniref:Uncharacterized protein n=1 Tax=Magnaporthiopsis poae (strain ATCC 64411 / 73-15) TaxID=644358 RepID=A0A0C4E0M3_MAGP6|nr:hypothetical protein MAPG_05904 [Magnaporthiopsis poae ATCC 64411]
MPDFFFPPTLPGSSLGRVPVRDQTVSVRAWAGGRCAPVIRLCSLHPAATTTIPLPARTHPPAWVSEQSPNMFPLSGQKSEQSVHPWIRLASQSRPRRMHVSGAERTDGHI